MLNTGVAFGWFPEIQVWVIGLVLVGVMVLAVKTRELWGRIGLWLMILGGSWNLYCRIWHGGVIDNLTFARMIYNNLADYLIFVGLVVYVWQHKFLSHD